MPGLVGFGRPTIELEKLVRFTLFFRIWKINSGRIRWIMVTEGVLSGFSYADYNCTKLQICVDFVSK